MWFDAFTGNIIGAVMGCGAGIAGGIWGALAGFSAPRGKRRRTVLCTGKALVVLGSLFSVLGLAALLARQPRHVWYPFLLVGLLLVVVLLPNYWNVKQVYRKAELKKMAVDDLG